MTNTILIRLNKMLLPYGLINPTNTIFEWQLKKVRWLNNETSIKHFTILVWIGLPTVSLIVWLMTRQNTVGIRNSLYGLNTILLISLIPMLLSSLYSIPLVIGTMNTHYTAKHWELMRLTSQNYHAILMGYDAFFQLRLWSLVIIEMGLRLSIFVIFIANHISESNNYFASTNVSFFASITFATWIVFPIVAFGFFIEPIFRMRVIIAAQMSIAVRVTNITFAFLVGAATIIITHLIHLILFDGTWAVFIAIAINDAGSGIALFCLTPIAVFGAALVFIFYVSIRNTALAMAYKSAFYQD